MRGMGHWRGIMFKNTWTSNSSYKRPARETDHLGTTTAMFRWSAGRQLNLTPVDNSSSQRATTPSSFPAHIWHENNNYFTKDYSNHIIFKSYQRRRTLGQRINQSCIQNNLTNYERLVQQGISSIDIWCIPCTTKLYNDSLEYTVRLFFGKQTVEKQNPATASALVRISLRFLVSSYISFLRLLFLNLLFHFFQPFPLHFLDVDSLLSTLLFAENAAFVAITEVAREERRRPRRASFHDTTNRWARNSRSDCHWRWSELTKSEIIFELSE